jgi:hypothetical protein
VLNSGTRLQFSNFVGIELQLKTGWTVVRSLLAAGYGIIMCFAALGLYYSPPNLGRQVKNNHISM